MKILDINIYKEIETITEIYILFIYILISGYWININKFTYFYNNILLCIFSE